MRDAGKQKTNRETGPSSCVDPSHVSHRLQMSDLLKLVREGRWAAVIKRLDESIERAGPEANSITYW